MSTTTHPEATALAGLRSAEQSLLSASLDLASVRPLLTGPRHARLIELVGRLDGLIATTQRLARVMEGDR